MKLLKKNQVIIYVIAVMLMVAGYLNYTTTVSDKSIQVSSDNSNNTSNSTNIGDARLVSSEVVNENTTNEINTTNQFEENNSISNEDSKETNEEIDTEETSVEASDYFAKSKLERDTMYSQMIETYEKVLNSSNALETQKQSATEEITKINNIKNSIMISENLLKTKGFENSVIFVNDQSISVIIGTKELKEEEIAQIQNIISREMKADIENIHISTK